MGCDRVDQECTRAQRARSVEKSKPKASLVVGTFVVLLSAMVAFMILDSRGAPTFGLRDGSQVDENADAFNLESGDGQNALDPDNPDMRVAVSDGEAAETGSVGARAGSLNGVLEGLGASRDDDPAPAEQAGPSLGATQNLEMVSSSGLRNTFDDASPWADLSADQISYGSITEPGAMPAGRPAAGIFHENCNFSHFAYDDSILFPQRAGVAHLHMFFGNTKSTAHSDNNTLRNSGASTCAHNELNRSSYWAPAVFNGDHKVLIPEIMNVYYTELDKNAQIVPFPEQFQMIQGNAMATEPPSALSDGTWPLYWKCGWHENARRGGSSGPAGQYQGTIPYCDPGTYTHLEMGIQFAHCWDGSNDGTNGDPKSHIRFPDGARAYGTCPQGTKHVPAIRMRIHFKLDSSFGPSNDWYLSSDVRLDSAGDHFVIGNRGASIHADWVNGWDPETLKIAVDTCLNVNRDCWRNLGDGRQAKLDPGQQEARTVAYYNGPLIAEAGSLDQLCPNRSGRSGPERALCDLSVMSAMASGG